MSPTFKIFGTLIISLIVAAAIIITAIVFRDTKYENVWLYITGLSPLLLTAFELYAKKKEQGQ